MIELREFCSVLPNNDNSQIVTARFVLRRRDLPCTSSSGRVRKSAVGTRARSCGRTGAEPRRVGQRQGEKRCRRRSCRGRRRCRQRACAPPKHRRRRLRYTPKHPQRSSVRLSLTQKCPRQVRCERAHTLGHVFEHAETRYKALWP